MKNYLFTIGNMSKFTGVCIKSLRYYEDIGILIPEHIDPKTKYRYYSYQQIPTVMAMRFCVELGIPLSNFKKYQDKEAGYLYYDELLQDGKKILEKKIAEVQKITQYISTSTEELTRSYAQNRGEIFRRDIENTNVLLKRETEETNRLHNVGLMIDEAKTKNLETGFEFGNCSLYSENQFEYYTFLDLNKNSPTNEQSYFPAGTYSCILDKDISVKDAPSIFPDIYKTNEKVLAVSSEIFSSKYELNAPLIELKVIGIEKSTF